MSRFAIKRGATVVLLLNDLPTALRAWVRKYSSGGYSLHWVGRDGEMSPMSEEDISHFLNFIKKPR